jgi:hypothetical protein
VSRQRKLGLCNVGSSGCNFAYRGGVGRDLGVGVGLGLAVGVTVGVGVGLGPNCAQYLPPVLKLVVSLVPPQTIISLPVETAVWAYRADGALEVLVAVQPSMAGLYLPPVLKCVGDASPPHTIISPPVQTAVWYCRA